jgi:hypothetical protein
MIIPVSGASALEQTDESFKDVSFYHDYSLAIDYLKENEIVKGYGDGSFKPDNTISRAEFAKIIVGSVAKIEDINEYDGKQCFPDVSISDPLNKYVCYAKDNEIIRGFDDGTYGPTLPISFHEASKILLESFGIEIGDMNSPDWYKTVLAKMSELNDIPESVKEFDKKITRGEMSELVLRVEEKDSNYISQKYEKDTNKFQSNISNIESCEVLKSKLDEFAQNDRGYPMLLNDVMAPMMKSADLQSMSESSVAGDYSQTNVQVAGVDEGDTIKNDGKYIYMVKDDSVRIVEAYPAENMKEIYNLDFSNDDFNPTE